jgi:hypothetical protein
MNKAELTARLKLDGFKDHSLAGTDRLVKYSGLDQITVSWGSTRVFVRVQHPDGADSIRSVSLNHPKNYELLKKFIVK